MILFLHGFGSCGWGEKSLRLRHHFGVERLIAPDLPFHPGRAFEHIDGVIRRRGVEALVGSSLGGFLATALNAEHRLPAVLINPVVRPHALLSNFLGPQRRWCDDMPFEVRTDYLDALRRLHRETLPLAERYLVLLQQGDEVLDYREAAGYYRDKHIHCTSGGSHRFEGLDRLIPMIDRWLRDPTRPPVA